MAPARPPAPATQAAPFAPPAPAPPAAAEVSPGWRASVNAWVEAHKAYPEAAKRRGEQGQVVLRFAVDHDGQVEDVAVMTGSGSNLLDESARKLLATARVPAFPSAMAQLRVTLTLRITYALAD